MCARAYVCLWGLCVGVDFFGVSVGVGVLVCLCMCVCVCLHVCV